MWIEYDIFHPSNTERSQNPRYAMTSRGLGDNVATCKFAQFELEQQVNSRFKSYAESLSPHERRRIWCDRVKAIVVREMSKDGTM